MENNEINTSEVSNKEKSTEVKTENYLSDKKAKIKLGITIALITIITIACIVVAIYIPNHIGEIQQKFSPVSTYTNADF